MTKIINILTVLLLVSSVSVARLRSLSLDMQADLFYTHFWLGYQEEALNLAWLKTNVACHFKEENKECPNIAALLGMLYHLTPKDEGLAYAKKIEPLLKHDEWLHKEIAMLLFMYGDKSFISEIDDEFVNGFNELSPPAYDQSLALKLLQAESAEQFKAGVKYVEQNHEQLPQPSVAIEIIKSIGSDKKHKHHYHARSFLYDFYYQYKVPSGDDGIESYGKIYVGSFVIDRANYLHQEPMSSVWKMHANNSKLTERCRTGIYATETEHFFSLFRSMPITDKQAKQKIKFILNTHAFKYASASFKIKVAKHLHEKFPRVSQGILRKAFLQASPVIKSTLIVEYPDLFQSTPKDWNKLKANSSALDNSLIVANHAKLQEK